MYRIIGDRSSGKTSRLMLLAKEHNGVFVCSNPRAAQAKAQGYGLIGFDIISYNDYMMKNYDIGKPCFIDELEVFVNLLIDDLKGYTLSYED